MGARGRGHIAALCRIARPTVGVVTTVGPAHTELFGTVEEVARAKGELVESLPPTGTAVLNAGVALVAAMAGRTEATVLTFGVGCGDVRATRPGPRRRAAARRRGWTRPGAPRRCGWRRGASTRR